MFFFKRKKIVVDAFTYNAGCYDFSKPQKASKFFPEWWKSMPTSYQQVTDKATIIERDSFRHCSGFIEWYKQGFVVPMWCDLMLETFEDGSFNAEFSWADSPTVTSHPPQQYGYALNDLIHCKLVPPWMLKEKTGVKFACVEPTWNYLDRDITMNILPGVVDYQVNSSCNVNIFFPKADQKMFFKHGDPLYHIIPITENDIEIKHHLVSQEEYNNINHWSGYPLKFRKGYPYKKKLVEKNGCPFSSK